MTDRLSLADARSLVDRARSEAAAREVPVSVAVVDPGGHLVTLDRMDGADFVSPLVAYGKAYTAAAFGASSAEVADRGRDIPQFVHAITVMTNGRFTPQAGGLPIHSDDRLLGAIGASGATGEEDVAILEAALADEAVGDDPGG